MNVRALAASVRTQHTFIPGSASNEGLQPAQTHWKNSLKTCPGCNAKCSKAVEVLLPERQPRVCAPGEGVVH